MRLKDIDSDVIRISSNNVSFEEHLLFGLYFICFQASVTAQSDPH